MGTTLPNTLGVVDANPLFVIQYSGIYTLSKIPGDGTIESLRCLNSNGEEMSDVHS